MGNLQRCSAKLALPTAMSKFASSHLRNQMRAEKAAVAQSIGTTHRFCSGVSSRG